LEEDLLDDSIKGLEISSLDYCLDFSELKMAIGSSKIENSKTIKQDQINSFQKIKTKFKIDS
jgi:hypothetical protein